MAKIYLEGMEFYAFHGCFDEEREIGTRFRVDLQFEVDTEKAQLSDNLEDTVSYLSVYQVVKREMEVSSKLLEHVGDRILNALLAEFSAVEKAVVKVAKLNPPLGGKLGSVCVEIAKERNGN